MFSNLNLVQKQIISNLFDMIIPLIPILYSFFVKKIVLFEYLSFFEVYGIVFMISNVLFYLLGKSKTIGENLTQINLVDVKSQKINHIKNLIRIIWISGVIFFLNGFENFNYEMLIILFVLIAPVKFVRDKLNVYSILNYSLGIVYLEREKLINKSAT